MRATYGNTKVGSILRLNKDVASWLSDIEPKDEAGEEFDFQAGTIFEVLEIYDTYDDTSTFKSIRCWVPAYNCYQSRLSLDSLWFDLISKP